MPLRRFLGDESGATAIEYGLIAALIALAIMVAVAGLGSSVRGVFNYIETQTSGAVHTN